MLDLFNEVEFQTASGQMIDLITTIEGEKDLLKYTLPVHHRIVQYKTAYYLPYAALVQQMNKQRCLEQILRAQERGSKVIICCATKRVVINHDFPNGVEDYVHQIGRTGRAGATGLSYTFFCDQDWKHAADLVKVLEGSNQQVPPEVWEMAVHGGPSFGKVQGGMNRCDSGGGRFDSRGGRGGMRDGSFGGRGGRNDFGGHGNQGWGFSGPCAGPIG